MGAHTLAYGIVLDNTTAMRTEQALQSSEARFATLFETTGAGMVITGARADIQFVNRAFAQLLGYEPSELLGKSIRDLSPQDTSDATLEMVRSMRAGEGVSRDVEKPYLHRSGKLVWARLTINIHNRPDGQEEFIGVIQDLTDRHEDLCARLQHWPARRGRGAVCGHPRRAHGHRHPLDGGHRAPPFWASQIRQGLGYQGPVDRWQIIRFEAPCTVVIDVGVAEAGTGAVPVDWKRNAGESGPEGMGGASDRSRGVNGRVLNTISPETDGTCHYFWAFARNYCIGEQRLTHELREGVARIFREDELVLEAQQKAMDAHPNHRFYNLNVDAGSMWARRLIDQMVQREQPAGGAPVIPIRQVA